MDVVVVVAYVVAALFLAWCAARAVTAAVELLGPRRKRWVERSPRDRRRLDIPLARDRRRGPRRQDDLATEFLERATGR